MRDCDFIPPAYHQKRELARSAVRRISLIGGMVILIPVWCIAHQRQLASASAMMNEVSAQNDQLQVLIQKKLAMDTERSRLERRETLVDQLSSPTQLGVILADISRRIPDSMLLTELRIKSPGLMRFVGPPEVPPVETVPSKPGAPPVVVIDPPKPMEQAKLTIAGLARKPQEVIFFAAALERSTLLDRVQIQSQGFTQWAGRSGEKFEIACELIDQRVTAK